jgi:hypothetical protein
MTLKEKFSLILMGFWSSDWESKCEQEAEDFAIGFTEWIVKNCNHSKLKTLDYKELLEIYKKEKGL